MHRLRGVMVRAGVGLARAAVLRSPHLLPAPPPHLVALLERDPTGGRIEPVDVVVVAPAYPAAAALLLPWARVVGIAAEGGATGEVLAPVPTVVGIEGLLDAVEDESLVLVDGDRGMVLVDPDAETVAAFQLARQQLGPRRRLFLEYAHQPARTMDGREARVLAEARTLAEVAHGVEQGADALYVPAGADLLARCAEPERALGALTALAEAASGKPVTIAADVETVDAAALLESARHLAAALAAPLAPGPDHFRLLAQVLHEAGAGLLAESVEYGDVLLAGRLPAGEALPAPLGEYAVERVVVEPAGEHGEVGAWARWLADLCGQAGGMLVPVEVILPVADKAAVERALALGASGLIVSAAEVQRVKGLVRETDAAAAREVLHGQGDDGARGGRNPEG